MEDHSSNRHQHSYGTCHLAGRYKLYGIGLTIRSLTNSLYFFIRTFKLGGCVTDLWRTLFFRYTNDKWILRHGKTWVMFFENYSFRMSKNNRNYSFRMSKKEDSLGIYHKKSYLCRRLNIWTWKSYWRKLYLSSRNTARI